MDQKMREEIARFREMRGILQDLFRMAPVREKAETLKTVRAFDQKIIDLEAKLRRATPFIDRFS